MSMKETERKNTIITLTGGEYSFIAGILTSGPPAHPGCRLVTYRGEGSRLHAVTSDGISSNSFSQLNIWETKKTARTKW